MPIRGLLPCTMAMMVYQLGKRNGDLYHGRCSPAIPERKRKCFIQSHGSVTESEEE